MADRRLERVLNVERWPSRDEARAMQWFSPLRIGTTEIGERTWVPAMVPWRATEDGYVTEQVLSWYRRFAEGRPGAIVVEATGIRDIPSGPLLRIGHDRYIPGLRQLADTVREASGGYTRLFIQLIDFLTIRRRPTKEKFFGRYLEIDEALRERAARWLDEPALRRVGEQELRERLMELAEADIEAVLTPRDLDSYRRGYRDRVTDTHLERVRELPRVLPGLFAEAARRAKEAGFDGVELHYAHAYTMASFLSARNTRDDGYGGPREHRVRLPLEVLQSVQRRVGDDYPVGIRFLGDEVIEGGSGAEDAMYFGVQFAAAGADYLSISKGGKFEDAKQPRVGSAVYPYTGRSGQECMPTVKIDAAGPFGRNVPLAAAVRRSVRRAGYEPPVVTSGGISSPWQAEEILRRGDADIVAAARQSLADPDWFRKIRLGYGDHVRRCLFTNYCEALDQMHKEVTCQRWDRDFDADDPVGLRSKDGKRRLVAPPWT